MSVAPAPAPRAGLRRGIAAPLALAALTLLFFAPLVAGGQLYFRDVSQNHYPLRLWESQEFAARRVPLWNPGLACGEPALANPNLQVLHPTTLLFLLLPADVAFRWSVLLQFFLGAAGMYALARELGCRNVPALVAGVGFAFAGPLASLGSLQNLLASAAWIPLAAWAALRSTRRGGPAAIAGASLSAAVVLVGGEPVLIATAFVLGALLVGLDPRRSGRGAGVRLARLAGIWVWGAAAAAAQILPAMELLRHSERGQGLSLADAGKWSLHPLRLPELVAPGWIGDPTAIGSAGFWGASLFPTGLPFLLGIYVGGPVLLLALAGLGARDRGRLPLALGGGALGAMWIALGTHAGLYAWMHHWLPGMDRWRYPEKLLLPILVATVLLAALGLGRLAAEGEERRPTLVPLLGLGLAAGCAGLAAALWLGAAPAMGLVETLAAGATGPTAAAGLARALAHAAAATAVASALIGAMASGRVRRPRAALWFVALVAVDLLAANVRLNPVLPAGWYDAPSPLLRTVREIEPAGRIYVFPRPDRFSVRQGPADPPGTAGFRWDRRSLRFATPLPAGARLAFDRNVDQVQPAAGTAAATEMAAAASTEERLRLWRLASTRFVASYGEIDHPALRAVDAIRGESSHPLILYEIPETLPRARVVGEALAGGSPAADVRLITAGSVDPGQSVLLPGPAAASARGIPRFSAAQILRDDPADVLVATTADFAGWLVLADTYFPGWTAEVDGGAAAIVPAYGVFRAVRVPPGPHRVTFRYRPASWRWGSALSGLALLGAMAAAAAGRRRGDAR